MVNSKKKYLFSLEECSWLLKMSFKGNPKAKVAMFEGLLVEYMKEHEYKAIIKGLRTVTDYGYEAQMALSNKNLYREAETLFFCNCYRRSIFYKEKFGENFYDIIIDLDSSGEMRFNRECEVTKTNIKKFLNRYWKAEDYYMEVETPLEQADIVIQN
ncbi:hypothetical protein M3676_07470 [Metabacillus litoralis]|nr:hypothetical protein [Metabacillus litoralis]MCM3409824.1 hypothetical protein [Metabacillus litoralis]